MSLAETAEAPGQHRNTLTGRAQSSGTWVATNLAELACHEQWKRPRKEAAVKSCHSSRRTASGQRRAEDSLCALVGLAVARAAHRSSLSPAEVLAGAGHLALVIGLASRVEVTSTACLRSLHEYANHHFPAFPAEDGQLHRPVFRFAHRSAVCDQGLSRSWASVLRSREGSESCSCPGNMHRPVRPDLLEQSLAHRQAQQSACPTWSCCAQTAD